MENASGRSLDPEHMVSIPLHLAALETGLVMGKMFDVVTWNIAHGLSGSERLQDTRRAWPAGIGPIVNGDEVKIMIDEVRTMTLPVLTEPAR